MHKNQSLAGIYIHIPFCKQACHYCDFHFSTQLKNKALMLDAINAEIEIQKDFLGTNSLSSVYFGGGTPSLLERKEIEQILNSIKHHYNLNDDVEITLEANPDDLSESKLAELAETSINRLSIGIQSFHDPHLKFMNRAHNASEADNSIVLAQKAGFDNLTVDLIYGVPSEDHKIWLEDIKKSLNSGVNHISAYCLTIEPNTVFGNWLQKNKIRAIDDEFAAQQFEILFEKLSDSGFTQYEISNFCRNDQFSRHNSSYWKGHQYLGIGPSAHSFDGNYRQFNIAHNQKYIKSIQDGTIPCTVEKLSQAQVANEYLLTTLRTIWGSSLSSLNEKFNGWYLKFENQINELINSDLILIKDDVIYLTQKGKLVADEITLQLFIEE